MKRLTAIALIGLTITAQAEPPDIEYIYPAGAQRGTTVPVRVGGYYFHGQANFEMLGGGIQFQPLIKRTKTIWFEGPLIYQPLSQQSENYPKDHLNEISVAKDADLGQRLWRCWTSQGATKTLKFVVGNLPEVMEDEIDGHPITQSVTLPVTANGRIFPREDIDIWTFAAKAGETIVIDAAAKRFGSPLNIVISVRDAEGNPVATDKTLRGGDPVHWFKVSKNGRYEVRIHDAKFWGLQNHIYRLTLKRGPHILSHYPLGARRGSTVEADFHGPALHAQRAHITIKNTKGDIYFTPVKNWGTAKFIISDYPEQLEEKKSTAVTPVVFNGRITKPGETDEWKIKLKEKQKIIIDLAAAQLGSPLDAVLTLHDADDKQLGSNDDRAKNTPDPRLEFTAMTAGEYTLKIRDRFTSRSGPSFAYRLTATDEPTPDFAVTLPASFYNVTRDPKGGLQTNAKEIAKLAKRVSQITEELKSAQAAKKTDPQAVIQIRKLTAENRTTQQSIKKLKAEDAKRRPKFKVTLKRLGGFKDEVKLNIAGLPKNVIARNTIIAPSVNFADVEFIAPANTKIDASTLSITGTIHLDGKPITRAATTPDGTTTLLLGIAPAVPFKHHGVYRIITGLPGGTTYHRKYTIDRGGFTEPITVSLADKQIRHLQGINDHLATVPKDVTEFAFPVKFPARIEVGRTSRVCVMLVGELTDFDGTKHKISYRSSKRDDQLISVAAEGLVSVRTPADSFTVQTNSEFTIPVTIRRDPQIMKLPMKIELLQPSHAEDIIAEPFDLEPGQARAMLTIKTNKSPGPFNAPFLVRASTTHGPRHVAEKKIEFVSPIE